MSTWIQGLAGWAAARIPTLLTLAALAALGIWGAATDWQLPRFAALWDPEDSKAEEPAAVKVEAVPQPAPSSAGPSVPVLRIVFPSVDAVRRTGLRLEKAQVRPMALYVIANGMLDYEPGCYAQLSARASGAVWSVEKEIGDPVQKGEVLALIDSADVGKAKADFLQAVTQFALRRQTLEQLAPAYRRGAIPDARYREAVTAKRDAEIRMVAAEQALANLGLPIHSAELQGLSPAKISDRLRFLGLESLSESLKARGTATANLLPLRAPFDGQVVDRRAAPGEVVTTNVPHILFMVGNVRRLHIEMQVRLEDAARLRVGQKVVFVPENAGGLQAVGTLSHISPEVDEKTRYVRAHAQAANPGNRLRPHTYGTGRILIQEHPHAVVVPSSAVQALPDPAPLTLPSPPLVGGEGRVRGAKSDQQTYRVFIRVAPTVFEARPVQPVLQDQGFTEVAGVHPGERVVTTGSHALKSELLKERIGGGGD